MQGSGYHPDVTWHLARADPVSRARAAFQQSAGVPPAGIAFAPGRVNLVGEHTDYNDGFVLPMAIEEGIAAAFAPNGDGVLRVHACDVGETREMPSPRCRAAAFPCLAGSAMSPAWPGR